MPQGEEVKRCKHWKHGCSRPSCKFRHPKGEGYYKPLKQCWFERYSQCTRRRCKFEHVKNKNGGARVKRLEEQVKVAQKLANELFKEVQKLQAAKAKEEVEREDIESQERKCGAETSCKLEISEAEEVYDLLENTHGEVVQANARKLERMREFGDLLQPRKECGRCELKVEDGFEAREKANVEHVLLRCQAARLVETRWKLLRKLEETVKSPAFHLGLHQLRQLEAEGSGTTTLLYHWLFSSDNRVVSVAWGGISVMYGFALVKDMAERMRH